MSKKIAQQFDAKRQETQDVAPTVLTSSRTTHVITSTEELHHRQREATKAILEEKAENPEPPEDQGVWEWPSNPNEAQEMIRAICSALRNGNAHLSAPIDEHGNRRVIWRGRRTRLLLPPDIYEKHYPGMAKRAILEPVDLRDSVSFGNIHPAVVAGKW